MDTYRMLENMADNINPVVNITVSEENCNNIEKFIVILKRSKINL